MWTYTIILEPEENGGFAVTVPALPGCFSQGPDEAQAIDRAAEAIKAHIAGLVADGEPVPQEHEQPRLRSVTVAA